MLHFLAQIDDASYDAPMDGPFEHNALYGLQHAAVGVVVLDDTYRVTAISPVAESMLGRSMADLGGKTLAELHPHGGYSRIDALLEGVRRGQTGSAASLIIPVPGRLLLLKITALAAFSAADPPPIPPLVGGFVLSLFDVLEVSRRAPPPAMATPDASYLLKLPIETAHGVSLLDLADVVCLKASGRYSEVKTRLGRPRLSSLSLKDCEERLDPSRFLRVHRAHIINVAYTDAFRRRGEAFELVMADDAATVIPIGRSRVSFVRERLGL